MSLSRFTCTLVSESRIHRPQIGFGPLRHSHESAESARSELRFLDDLSFHRRRDNAGKESSPSPPSIKGLGVRALEQAAVGHSPRLLFRRIS